MIFEDLTRYIEKFDGCEDFGHYEDDPSRKGRTHYVVYPEEVQQFEKDFKEFVRIRPQYKMMTDGELIHETGMSGSIPELMMPDVSGWNARQVLSIINWYINFQLIGEGCLLEVLKNGTILNCLKRLKELES